MGRPPGNGAPSFRFHPAEVTQMDAILQENKGQVPSREFLVGLAHRFSQSPERAGKIAVQMKQVWNWFQNRRYALRAKLVKSPGKQSASFIIRDEATPLRYVLPGSLHMSSSSGPHFLRNTSALPATEFEARSARDGAWYDVQEFLSHRYLETGNPEVLVCFAGFNLGEDEWVNIRKHVRQRSLPCETSECIAVLPGDLILCFQEGKEQALYFDAHVLDAQRRAHDIRGCRCRFLVRFDHDKSEEIVPVKKICRRPETDDRLPLLHASNEASMSVTVQPPIPVIDLTNSSPVDLTTPNPSSTAIVTVSPLPVVITGPQAPTTSPIGSPGPKSLPVPPKKVENNNTDQIRDPVTDANKIETDKAHLVPGVVTVASNSSGPVSVPVKVENESSISDPLPKPNNVESINLGISDGETGPRPNYTGPVAASMVLKAEKMENSVAETVALTGSSGPQVESAKTQPK